MRVFFLIVLLQVCAGKQPGSAQMVNNEAILEFVRATPEDILHALRILEPEAGLEIAGVSFQHRLVLIRWNPGSAFSLEELTQLLADAGFEFNVKEGTIAQVLEQLAPAFTDTRNNLYNR